MPHLFSGFFKNVSSFVLTLYIAAYEVLFRL
jgi:hypothetical protein